MSLLDDIETFEIDPEFLIYDDDRDYNIDDEQYWDALISAGPPCVCFEDIVCRNCLIEVPGEPVPYSDPDVDYFYDEDDQP